MDDDEGSSPLARGLRRYCGRVVLCYRIIPARAGFTTLSRRIPGSCSDHPRSRGVYFSCAWGMILPARIIPARAGFTPMRKFSVLDFRDHPRSRGVYHRKSMGRRAKTGSSPLARGLLRVYRKSSPGTRIIPARAGFTTNSFPHGSISQDHPRSRGVYWFRAKRGLVSRGSSPLARGLHGMEGGTHVQARIIPARAGFTRRFPAGSSWKWDHPRSRGVYSTHTLV